MSFLLTVVGVVLVVEGVPWFLSPEKSKRFLVQIYQMPDKHLRFFGLTAMIVGLIIVRLSH